MKVRDVAAKQYQTIINHAARQFDKKALILPVEGWIATVRKALGMSGPQLAKRIGVTRARVSKVENAESEGAVTLKTMNTFAEAMGCRFVYAIVPEGHIEDVIRAQARKKAKALVTTASSHMALEGQSLSEARNAEKIELIASELARTMPSDFWMDK